jgi:hypothetical protein
MHRAYPAPAGMAPTLVGSARSTAHVPFFMITHGGSMSDLASDYIDLVSSGDGRKISCVLLAAGAAAGASGLAAGVIFAPANVVPVAGQGINATAAGIGAVLGAFLAASKAYHLCGGEATKGSFKKLFTSVRVPAGIVERFETDLQRAYGISAHEARLLSKAAHTYSMTNPGPPPHASFNEKKNAVAILLAKLKAEGVA